MRRSLVWTPSELFRHAVFAEEYQEERPSAPQCRRSIPASLPFRPQNSQALRWTGFDYESPPPSTRPAHRAGTAALILVFARRSYFLVQVVPQLQEAPAYTRLDRSERSSESISYLLVR